MTPNETLLRAATELEEYTDLLREEKRAGVLELADELKKIAASVTNPEAVFLYVAQLLDQQAEKITKHAAALRRLSEEHAQARIKLRQTIDSLD